ncbi:MAG: ABC transporter ATP-binding protein [Ruminococcaceae bacterium]|nr:ABC transporter ATP-binding protein [Oscillospiraceae bacterium]
MLRRLLKCVREYKLHAILSPLFVCGEVIMEVFIPLVMAHLIDEGVYKGEMNVIIKTGVVLVASALISLMFGAFCARSAAIASAGFAKNVRHDMFYKVQGFSFNNIDKFSTASIVTRLTTDVANVQNSFQMIIRGAVRSPFMLIFSVIMTARISLPMSLIFLGIIPVLGIGLYILMSGVHPIFKQGFKTYDKINCVIQENLHGARVVKSYVREDYENKKFRKISQKMYELFTKADKRMAWSMPLMQLCIYATMLLISWFGARLIIASGNDAAAGMSTGELMSLITYAMQILMSFMMVAMMFVMVIMSRASMERIVEVLNEESDMTDPESPVTEVPDGSVRFENVSFSYSGDDTRLCLKNINIDIKSGETVGIIGGTGSAKSTLVSLIPRLYDVTEGSVIVGGHDVREYSMDSLRNDVSVVLQKNVLFSGTIKENLRWGDADATDEDIERVCRLACADEFIQGFPDKYDTYIEQGGTNVSGGQKQRLCIARALLKHPKILILDDSTSAVDTKTDAMIRSAFESEIPDTTKFIIAQRISSVEHADKIIVLEDGEIRGVGTHEELLGCCDIYREVFESQTKGGEDNE